MTRIQRSELTHNDRLIFEQYQDLVGKVVNKYFMPKINGYNQQGIAKDDLYQFGYIGLMQAILNYDPKIGQLEFKYFAASTIKNYINNMSKSSALYSSSKKHFEKVQVDDIQMEVIDGLSLIEVLEDETTKANNLLDVIMQDDDYIYKLLIKVNGGKKIHNKAVDVIKLRYQGVRNIDIAKQLNINTKGINQIVNTFRSRCTPEKLLEIVNDL